MHVTFCPETLIDEHRIRGVQIKYTATPKCTSTSIGEISHVVIITFNSYYKLWVTF